MIRRKLKALNKFQFFFVLFLVSVFEFINDVRVRIFVVIGFFVTLIEILISGFNGFTFLFVASFAEAAILERLIRYYAEHRKKNY